MASAPAIIFVARHGARLDAADKSWHLTSPTPYDPPLTYGGWNQCKALGARIASILQSKMETIDRPVKDWRHAYKLVIHSSPFLRCLQTSTAISAGISEQPKRVDGARRVSPTYTTKSPPKSTIHEEDDDSHSSEVSTSSTEQGVYKVLLRVDAFLGEWFTTDYYEEITPPPGSMMMVAGAKAELLRKEPIDVFKPESGGKGHFPGGWNKPGDTPLRVAETTPDEFGPPSAVQKVLPSSSRTHRSSSYSSGSGPPSLRMGPKAGKDIFSTMGSAKGVYTPPVPAYAVSPLQTIPRGYTTHAQESCVDIDFQWDSSRAPQNWGDGGEYGEEWSSMHKRFRHGLYHLVSWYKTHKLHQNYDEHNDPLPSPGLKDDTDDRELVVILVTHGAGCNALIGGLTNQPVLMDVGMASLTMAVQRPMKRLPSQSDLTLAPTRSVSYGLSEEYEMKITASSDHLRAGTDATNAKALHSPNLVPRIPEYKRRAGLPSSTKNRNSSLGSMRRSTTLQISTAAVKPRRGSMGLWGASTQDAVAEFSENQIEGLSLGPPVVSQPIDTGLVTSPLSIDLSTLRIGEAKDDKALGDTTKVDKESTSALDDDEDEEDMYIPALPSRAMSQFGLWAPAGSKDGTQKRRWTVTDRDAK